MTNRNWDKARALDRTRIGPELTTEIAVEHTPARKRSATPFPIVYARYANAERTAGRKPLPPKQWIASLQNGRRPT